MSNYEGAFGGNTENVNEKNPWEGLANVEPNRQLESFGSDSEMVDVPSIQARELDGFGSEPSKERVPDDVKHNDGPKVVFREFGTNGDERESLMWLLKKMKARWLHLMNLALMAGRKRSAKILRKTRTSLTVIKN